MYFVVTKTGSNSTSILLAINSFLGSDYVCKIVSEYSISLRKLVAGKVEDSP